jgi:hypothetical protein
VAPVADRREPQALFWQQCGWLAHDFLHHQARPFAHNISWRLRTDNG